MRRYAEGLQDFLLAEERESDFINFSTFKDIIYEINMQEKYSTLRSRYLDEFNIGALKDELKFLVQIKYEKHTLVSQRCPKEGPSKA